MVGLAISQPDSYELLEQTKGVGNKLLKYNGQDILKAIQRGQDAPPPRYQAYHNNNDRPDDKTLNRYEMLRHWRNTLASDRGVEPDVIISNDTLMHIARLNPRNLKALSRIKQLGSWQQEQYGQELLKVLRNK